MAVLRPGPQQQHDQLQAEGAAPVGGSVRASPLPRRVHLALPWGQPAADAAAPRGESSGTLRWIVLIEKRVMANLSRHGAEHASAKATLREGVMIIV